MLASCKKRLTKNRNAFSVKQTPNQERRASEEGPSKSRKESNHTGEERQRKGTYSRKQCKEEENQRGHAKSSAGKLKYKCL